MDALEGCKKRVCAVFTAVVVLCLLKQRDEVVVRVSSTRIHSTNALLQARAEQCIDPAAVTQLQPVEHVPAKRSLDETVTKATEASESMSSAPVPAVVAPVALPDGLDNHVSEV